MKAMVVRKHGDVSVLDLREVADPSPGPGQILISVRAIGVNFADVLARLGIYDAAPKPPFIPGLEVAGVVEALGEGVEGFARGDRVMAFCTFGGYAEKAAVAASAAMKIPAGMTFPEAAAFPVQYITAWHGLFQLAHVRSADTVLVHAAAGGVGIATLQLLRPLGCAVFATVGSDSKVQAVKEEYPSARVIVYTREDFYREVKRATDGRGVDVVMDSVGGETFRKSWRLLAPNGRHILFGAAAAVKPGAIAMVGALWRLRGMFAVRPLVMIGRNRTLSAFNLYHLAGRSDLMGEATSDLFRRYGQGALRPRVGLSLPLEKAAEAHRRLQGRQTIGKVVLTVG